MNLSNPAQDNFIISISPGQKATVSIINMAGQVVQTQNVLVSAQQINISKLSAGQYFIKIELPGETVIQKFIKQ
ncbi:MAG: T9SS type A sorting domain-containing protein [Bacteroidia bacterium]|nr:T9SS type A sorting domain-containing protein [Bacteroidia bacterium]